jgi:hypothetical protein
MARPLGLMSPTASMTSSLDMRKRVSSRIYFGAPSMQTP